MRLKNTSPSQDNILSECEAFGGKAAEGAEVAQELDNLLSIAVEKTNELDSTIKELTKEIDGLKEDLKLANS